MNVVAALVLSYSGSYLLFNYIFPRTVRHLKAEKTRGSRLLIALASALLYTTLSLAWTLKWNSLLL